jgi:phosphopentomutase
MTAPTRVLLIFLDGVGLGENDPAINPFLAARLPTLDDLLDGQRPRLTLDPVETSGATLIPTDALLGVDGVPQSATGQATILTGTNAAQANGGHWGPLPTPAIRDVVERESIFRKLRDQGRRALFANAYPARYFHDVDRGKKMISVSPLAALAGGQRLRGYEDLRMGRALSSYLTNQGWREVLGYTDLPPITPYQAGCILGSLAQDHDFTLFEHYHTDVCGHHQDMAGAVAILEALDEFLAGVLHICQDNGTLVLITSDHGNVEDMRVRGHTTNPVPTILIGPGHSQLAASIRTLADITPTLLTILGNGR